MSSLIIRPSDESLLMSNAELRLMVERRGDELAKQSKALGRLKAENKRLKAESAELRDKYETLESAYDVIVASCRAKAERINDLEDLLAKNGLPTGGTGKNAKLRELVVEMQKAMRRMEDSAGMDGLVGHAAWFAPKLCELGIEVDDD